MTRGNSGYARVPAELYQTPAWVLDALVEHVPLAGKLIWEPACGEGKLVRAMERHGARVHGTDLYDHGFVDAYSTSMDFLKVNGLMAHHDGIISNPPYGLRGALATAFIRHGAAIIAKRGFMALLLPIDFDNAKSRRDCFADSPAYCAKISLTKRIKWFDVPPEPGKKKQGPTENHAWFVWEATAIPCRQGVRQLYAPTPIEESANAED
jgi:hypothetical protein